MMMTQLQNTMRLRSAPFCLMVVTFLGAIAYASREICLKGPQCHLRASK